MGRFDVNVPSALPGLRAVEKALDTRLGFERDKAAAGAQKQLHERAAQVFKTGTDEEMADFMIKNPSVVDDMNKIDVFMNERTERDAVDNAWDIVARGKTPSVGYTEHAQMVQKEGGDPSRTLTIAEESQKNQDVGLRDAKVLLYRKDREAYVEFLKSRGEGGEADIKVGAQEILEDGTIIQSTATGPVVYNPQGVKVTGEAASDAISTARAVKVSNLRAAAGGKRESSLEAELKLKAMVEAKIISAKAAANVSVKAFEKVEKIHTNIANLHEVGRLIDEGAETGAIAKHLPSFRKSSLMLENLQAGLGLDVLHSTTFGALSEKELAFALSTALPVGLEGPALKEWATLKIEAQEKLADYLESSAMYLGTPGNTVKGWIEYQRNKAGDKYGRKQINDLPEGVTEEQLTFTMDKYKMTREQVLARLAGQ